jgi:hypothetical protein
MKEKGDEILHDSFFVLKLSIIASTLDKSSHQHLCLKKRHRKNSKRQSSRQIYLQGDIIQQYQAMKLHTIPQ